MADRVDFVVNLRSDWFRVLETETISDEFQKSCQ